MHKKHFLHLFAFCILCSFAYLKLNNSNAICGTKFIISKKSSKIKKLSKTKLKEKIGQELKEVLDNCAQMSKQLGVLQVKLAQIQSHMLPKVETLINNIKPFKKASRDQLTQTLKLTNNITLKLKDQILAIDSIKSQINKDDRLK